ncbi:hypothetical protein Pmani_012907 [Petrolisthes manimaculis]|uniref:Uncharacterized protein n=1 Tax=Petrolisthes manimaculis TaxID=1843537 RepID=A0AAE1PZX4_9EUCA|nr:hypothetical protein Pmani_012907 [Petrolisthes manimaculis]
MDSDSFFEFDASIPPEDGGLEAGVLESEEYDALNDETFGSAAVDGDWEESHEHLSSLEEAGKRDGARAAHHHQSQEDDGGLLGELRNLGLGRYDGHNSNSSAPISMVGYPGSHSHVGSSLLGGPDLPGSPSDSIWTPSPGVDKLRPVTHTSQPHPHPPHSNGLNQPIGPLPGLSHPQPNPVSHMTLPTIKTVAELEEEMKLQHARTQPGPLHITALRAEDLERELARQSVGKSNLQQVGSGSIVGSPSQQQLPQFNHQRMGPFNNLPHPGGHAHLNRPFQRPPLNQGNFAGGPMQQQQQFAHRQQQQQRFMNSFQGSVNSKNNITFNHHPMHHPRLPHHHNEGGFGNFHHHHPHHYNNHPHPQQQQQQQQQNYHYHNRNQESMGGGHYFYHNGYDRRGFDRRPYDQNKSQYDRTGDQRGGRGDDHGGGRTRRDSEAEWEEWHRKREQDEYCGLMTPREKGWLKYIQAMQLHTDSPYQDDYYYVMHSVKQQRKREDEVIEIDGLQLLLPDRGKDGGREYEPPRLENSLGKLQVVSVNAPRKIIDLQVVHLDPSHPTTPMQREMRKHRHLLLYVEKLFNVMMELDDLERKIRHLPDCPTRDLFQSKSRKQAARLWQNITAAPDILVQLLCIRKGKSLLNKVIRWLGEEECVKLVRTVLQNMPLLVKKDVHDQHLALFWPMTDRLAAAATHVRLLELAVALTSSTSQSSQISTQKTNLATALSNKYGVSLVLAMMVRGEQLQASLAESEVWQEFLASVVAALTSPTSLSDSNKADMPQALPSVALAASPFPPAHHLSRCNSQADPKLVRAAQDRMALLETATINKTSSQTPVKS